MATLYDELVRQSVQLGQNPLAPFLTNQERAIKDTDAEIADIRRKIALGYQSRLEEGMRTRLQGQEHANRMEEITALNAGRLDVANTRKDGVWTKDSATRRNFQIEDQIDSLKRGLADRMAKSKSELDSATASLHAAQLRSSLVQARSKLNEPGMFDNKWQDKYDDELGYGNNGEAAVKLIDQLLAMSDAELAKVADGQSGSKDYQKLVTNVASDFPPLATDEKVVSAANKEAVAGSLFMDLQKKASEGKTEEHDTIDRLMREQSRIPQDMIMPDEDGTLRERLLKPQVPLAANAAVSTSSTTPTAVPTSPIVNQASQSTQSQEPPPGVSDDMFKSFTVPRTNVVLAAASPAPSQSSASPRILQQFKQASPVEAVLRGLGWDDREVAVAAQDASQYDAGSLAKMISGVQMGNPQYVAALNQYRSMLKERLSQPSAV